jgi:hypothetical protein
MAKPAEITPELAAFLSELKQATREAHEAAQSIREALREAKAFAAEQLKADAIEARIAEHVKQGLAEYDKVLMTAIDTATDKVYERFDLISQICLGEDFASKRDGLTPTMELVRRYVMQQKVMGSDVLRDPTALRIT